MTIRLNAVFVLVICAIVSVISLIDLPTYLPWDDEKAEDWSQDLQADSPNNEQVDKFHHQQQQQQQLCSVNDSSTFTTVENVCRCIPHWTAGSSTTASWTLWHRMEDKIRKAARDSLNDCWHWNNALQDLNETDFDVLTGNMFSALNSYRMERSIKSKPNPLIMERVLQVILRRLENPADHPPLRIAVFGGSVTEGCWSGHNLLGLHQLDHHCDIPCTWTTKLERLLNNVLGNGTVVVRNYAVAGTDSSVGSTLLEYNLWKDPDFQTSDFDIFVSAYSSNDGQTPGAIQDALYESMQRFLRLCTDQRPCSDLPLVIQLEDTMLDSVHKTVRTGLRFVREMVETASWGHFMSVSYADTVREHVYRNPNDETLTQFGQLHPGLTFHTGVAWTLAYNLLHSLLDACNAPTMPEYNNPEPRAGYPLPILHNQLRSEQVHSLWNTTSQEKAQRCAQGNTATKCMYKWVAMKQDARTAKHVQEAIAQHAIRVNGWKATGFPVKKPRRTFQAERANATFTLQFDNLETSMNRLMVLYLRSYGKKWESTRLRVVVEGKSNGNEDWIEITRFDLEGAHDSETSINYSHSVNLGESSLPAGSSTRLTFTLVGGNVFQINGLALCQSPN